MNDGHLVPVSDGAGMTAGLAEVKHESSRSGGLRSREA